MDKIKEIVKILEKTMKCNCDLDNWQPTRMTGHSEVCRIHRETIEKMRDSRSEPA